jgi:hypothetical protein
LRSAADRLRFHDQEEDADRLERVMLEARLNGLERISRGDLEPDLQAAFDNVQTELHREA